MFDMIAADLNCVKLLGPLCANTSPRKGPGHLKSGLAASQYVVR